MRPTKFPSVCLTDCAIEPAEGWEIRHIKRVTKDLRRASRHPKMLPHLYFPDEEISIYIDGNISLLRDPVQVVEKWLGNKDLAVFRHPQRKSVYAEAAAVIDFRKASKSEVQAQIKKYKAQGYPGDFGLSACFVLVRRHTQLTRKLGERWWVEYMQYSCRDQLSFDYVRWLLGVERAVLKGNVFKNTSPYFTRRKHSE